jgi:hypothetical protein
MERANIYRAITEEREYQEEKWGDRFDKLNTPNDWIAYITLYAGKAVTLPWDINAFRKAVLKVAAICVAILEREQYAPRHYDK